LSRLIRPLLAALAVLAVLVLGIWLGGHPNDLPGGVASKLVDKQTRIVSEALDTIDDTYYRKPSRSELADNAITGMVQRLDDRFSTYFTPKQYAAFQREQRTEFTGIGVLVAGDKLGLRVLRVYDGSPAAKGGVKPGDVIVRAANHSLKGLDQRHASAFVTGKPGSAVRIVVKRNAKHIGLNLRRATVVAGFTETRLVRHGKDKIGVVALSQFGPGAHADVYKSLQRLKHQGATRYVLDLRDNGGGLVSEAQLIASAFLKNGTIVTTKGRSVPENTLRAVGNPILPNAPLVVLVNRNTASASEIVAGALQDRKRAEVVGTRTFGKGVFQEVIELSNGGALDITAGQYFTPSGRNLGGKGVNTGAGIAPDVKASDNLKTTRDEALDRAVAVVLHESART
jgi:carboxyl-terminal processing protease